MPTPLLRLHKSLLDAEHAACERAHGHQVTGGELLQLVFEHEQYASCLRHVSEFVGLLNNTGDSLRIVASNHLTRRPWT